MLEMVNHTENGECSDIMVGFMRFPFANLNTIDVAGAREEKEASFRQQGKASKQHD